MSEPTGARRYGTGGGDAYYDAVKYGGYEGTREQFGKDQAEFATNATAVAAAKEVVEQDTEEVRSTKETFVNTTVPEAITAIQQEGTTQVQAVTQQGEESSQQVEAVGTQWKDEIANEGRARVQAVEQAGTTQVQAVNDAGTTQVGAVNQAGEDQVAAVGQAGTDQVQAVTDEGTTQVGAVTGEGDTQVQRVQDKGDEVIASIPADYAALDQEVDNLNRHLSDLDTDKQDAPATAGTAGQVLSLDSQLNPVWADQTGGGGGMNIVNLSGTQITQVGADNTFYVCGELTELTFTAPAVGITMIRFTSGSTPTVLTVNGVTSWMFDNDPTAASLEANKTYDINVLNGVGVVGWA